MFRSEYEQMSKREQLRFTREHWKQERELRAAAICDLKQALSGERVRRVKVRASEVSDDNLLSEVKLYLESGRAITLYADYHVSMGYEVSEQELSESEQESLESKIEKARERERDLYVARAPMRDRAQAQERRELLERELRFSNESKQESKQESESEVSNE